MTSVNNMDGQDQLLSDLINSSTQQHQVLLLSCVLSSCSSIGPDLVHFFDRFIYFSAFFIYRNPVIVYRETEVKENFVGGELDFLEFLSFCVFLHFLRCQMPQF